MNKNKLKALQRLQKKKYRHETKLYLVEGFHLVKEAYLAGVLKEVYALKPPREVEGINFEIVDEVVIKKLSSSVTPQPIVGLCEFKDVQINSEMKRLVALENIQDPGNLGTIIRTALAFNYDGVILSEDSVDLYNDKVLRSTQGAHFHLPVVVSQNLFNQIGEFKKTHQIITTDLKGDVYDESMKTDAFVLVFGNEGKGLSHEMKILSSQSLYLPIQHIDSLNVAVTAGILLYLFQV